ncbi:MAG TPA: peroxiredoxin [Thermoplasmata archaeon]|nr:peroxiredoxin [Thermoplasmata archaeon]
MVEVGELAPDFSAPTESGKPLMLSSLRGRPVILYFFPKANSPGCTVETCAFADNFPKFDAAGYAIVGVSVDPVSAQAEFASRCEVQFPLVADTTRSIARAYGVLGFLGFARRVTFFLGPDGIVQEIVSAIGPSPHIDRALERAAQLTPK